MNLAQLKLNEFALNLYFVLLKMQFDCFHFQFFNLISVPELFFCVTQIKVFIYLFICLEQHT